MFCTRAVFVSMVQYSGWSFIVPNDTDAMLESHRFTTLTLSTELEKMLQIFVAQS